MRSVAILEIIAAVESLEADDAVKRQVKRLVSEIAHSHGIKTITGADRVEFAGRLLDAKVSAATVRDRLTIRYSISRTHAYRIIEKARNRPKTTHEMGRRER